MGEKRSEISKRIPQGLVNAVSFADSSANRQDSKTTFESIKKETTLSSEVSELIKLNSK